MDDHAIGTTRLSGGEGVQQADSIMEALIRVDLDLTCSSEKLVNLQIILMHLSAWDNDLEVMAMSATSIQKALEFDLLSGILDSEVQAVENFIGDVQTDIANACHEISLCRNLTGEYTMILEKLRDSEESLKKTQKQVSEAKMQSTKLQRALSAFKLENWEDDKALEFLANNPPSAIHGNSKRQAAEQQRHILRMLEKSLARELDLERRLSELRQNEEQMKLKLHYTEQVASRMEEAAEVIWGRFLEAENAAEVLMGISKELVGRLQIFQFNLNGSFQREAELKSNLQECIQMLDAKDTATNKLENNLAEHMAKSSEVPNLLEKVQSLEEQLKRSELRLKDANALNEESHEQLSEMEHIVDSLKESVFDAESRAETAEAKVTELTDSNLELNEEVNFLKSSRDSDTKKFGLLEKQVRELELQLQHAKVSSEASQEQQNMLYSAIWDMETLIDDLKSKISKAESKTENVEEQCINLSETNLELNEELSFLRARVKSLETALDEANNSRATSAIEINLRTKLIMDTAVQLAGERERIQNQLLLLTTENKILMGKLRNAKRNASVTIDNSEEGGNRNLVNSKNVLSNEHCGEAAGGAPSLSESLQADEASEGAALHEPELGSFDPRHSTDADLKVKLARTGQAGTGRHNAVYQFIKGTFGALVVSVAYICYTRNYSYYMMLNFEDFW